MRNLYNQLEKLNCDSTHDPQTGQAIQRRDGARALLAGTLLCMVMISCGNGNPAQNGLDPDELTVRSIESGQHETTTTTQASLTADGLPECRSDSPFSESLCATYACGASELRLTWSAAASDVAYEVMHAAPPDPDDPFGLPGEERKLSPDGFDQVSWMIPLEDAAGTLTIWAVGADGSLESTAPLTLTPERLACEQGAETVQLSTQQTQQP